MEARLQNTLSEAGHAICKCIVRKIQPEKDLVDAWITLFRLIVADDRLKPVLITVVGECRIHHGWFVNDDDICALAETFFTEVRNKASWSSEDWECLKNISLFIVYLCMENDWRLLKQEKIDEMIEDLRTRI